MLRIPGLCIIICLSANAAFAQRHLGELPLPSIDRIEHICFSDNSMMIAACWFPKHVKGPLPLPVVTLFDLEARKDVHAHSLNGIPYLTAFLSDGSLLTCIGTRKRFGDSSFYPIVQIWGGRKWEEVRSFTLPELASDDLPRFRMTLSPKGDVIASWKAGRWSFFDVSTGKERFSVEHKEPMGLAAFSPDGKLFAAGGKDHKVHVIDVARHKTVSIHKQSHWGAWEPARICTFTPDGKHLALLSTTLPSVVLCDPFTGEVNQSYKWRAVRLGRGACFLLDGKTLLTSSLEHGFGLRDLESGRESTFGEAKPGSSADHLAVSRDGGLVAWSKREGPIHLWRLKPAKVKKPEEP